MTASNEPQGGSFHRHPIWFIIQDNSFNLAELSSSIYDLRVVGFCLPFVHLRCELKSIAKSQNNVRKVGTK